MKRLGVVLTLGLMYCVAGPHAQVDSGLFLQVERPAGLAITPDNSVLRQRWITVDATKLAPASAASQRLLPDSLLLNLFADATYIARLDRVEPTAGGFVWVGHLENLKPSSVTIAVTSGNVLAGSITTPDETYAVRYAGNGVHEVQQLDPSRLPPGAPPVVPPAAAADIDSPVVNDDGGTIDLLVVFTPSARAAHGDAAGIQSMINVAVSNTNQAYANSGVVQRVQLVGTAEVAYTESSSGFTDLHRLQNPSDGFMDDVETLRNAYAADVVQLVLHLPTFDACGIAYMMQNLGNSFAPFAVGFTDQRCLWGRSMAHELGHNMGLNHDIYVSPDPGSFPYSHGYVNQAAFASGAPSSARWRDIMAYGTQCTNAGFSCQEIPYFSNAGISYLGDPTGAAGTAEGARTLNETRLVVANFRTSTPLPGSFSKGSPPAGIVNVGSAATLSWGNSDGAASYEYCLDTTDNNACAGWTSVGTNTSVVVGLQPATLHLWQVRAVNSGGATEADGGAWRILATGGAGVYSAARQAPLCSGINALCDSGALLNSRNSLAGNSEPNQPNALGGSCQDGASGGYHINESIDRIRVTTLDDSSLGAGKTVSIQVTVWADAAFTNDRLDLFHAANASAPAWTYLTTLTPSGSGARVLSTTYTLPSGAVQAVRARFGQSSSTSPCLSPSGIYTDVDDLVFRVQREPFTNDTLVPHVDSLRAVHVTELRTRINSLRAQLGLAAVSWTDASLGSLRAKAAHVAELRAALLSVFSVLSRNPPAYTDPALAAGTVIKAAHINELRTAVGTLEP